MAKKKNVSARTTLEEVNESLSTAAQRVEENKKYIYYALGAIASYSEAKEVPYARVVFCDAEAYDAGYISPGDIAGRVEVKGRGGTVLQPAVDLLQHAEDFPKDAPILLITDGMIESDLSIKREHAYLLPRGGRLPFRAKGQVFYFEQK